jgi:hypothetical protein
MKRVKLILCTILAMKSTVFGIVILLVITDKIAGELLSNDEEQIFLASLSAGSLNKSQCPGADLLSLKNSQSFVADLNNFAIEMYKAAASLQQNNRADSVFRFVVCPFSSSVDLLSTCLL